MRSVPVLLVDDDEIFRSVLANELTHLGFEVMDAEHAEAAEEILRRQSFAVALLDMQLPGKSGLEALHALHECAPGMEVIILTAHGEIDTAVAAIQQGAYNYVTKPCPLGQLQKLIHEAANRSQFHASTALNVEPLELKQKFPEFIGQSDGLLKVIALLDQVAASDSIVLIQGESGVGKELAARAIHRLSPRSEKPFVVIDCTTLQESLLESELFGHERGAYTGASGLKHGLFEVADGGTVFMDEVGELSLAIQAKLLRVIEQSSFRRVGGTEMLQVDVRFVFATNRDLEQLVEQHLFRADLFYRINGFPIRIPPLRERREDISLLAAHFIETAPAHSEKRLAPSTLRILERYEWPGNVRELEHVVRRALILCQEDEITPDLLPSHLRAQQTSLQVHGELRSLEEIELEYIRHVLDEVDGHRSRAAAILGISERTLYRKLRQLERGLGPRNPQGT